MGNALVGLQRIFLESEWPDLSAGGGVFWFRRHAAKLLSAALLHESVSPHQARLAAGTVRYSAGSLYSGYYLLCGKTSHRPGHCVVNVLAWSTVRCSISPVVKTDFFRRAHIQHHKIVFVYINISFFSDRFKVLITNSLFLLSKML